MPGLSRNTTNAVIFYEKYKVSAPRRVEQARELPHLDHEPAGQPAVHERLLAARRRAFGYQVTEKIAVVFEAINLTDENVDQYNIVGLTSRREQLYYISNSGRRMQAGVRVRL